MEIVDAIIQELRNVDVFRRDALQKALSNLGRELGFEPVENYRVCNVHLPCVWKDGSELYFVFDTSFSGLKEFLGTILIFDWSKAKEGLILTASKPFLPFTEILSAAKKASPRMILHVVDVKTWNRGVIR